MGRLTGKVALVTGVASGIGKAVSRLFVQEGAIVFGVDRDAAAGQSLALELDELHPRQFHFFAVDLATENACTEAVLQCQSTCGRIDILYNNAGVSILEPFLTTSAAMLEQIMAVNFRSVFYLCQQVIPIMQHQGGGTIINTASELAIVAQPLYAAYCASKGAVLSLTRALALEHTQDHIRINALCPGPIDTPMLQKEFDTAVHPEQAKTEGIATMPIGRLGKPEEIAQVALFLASDAPMLLQGASIVVDGGKTII